MRWELSEGVNPTPERSSGPDEWERPVFVCVYPAWSLGSGSGFWGEKGREGEGSVKARKESEDITNTS